MEILSKSLATVQWNPGCQYYSGNQYAVGAIGRAGPRVSAEQIGENSKITEIPQSLSFDFVMSPTDFSTISDFVTQHDPEVFLEKISNEWKSIPNPNYNQEMENYQKVAEKEQKASEIFKEMLSKMEEAGLRYQDYLFSSSHGEYFRTASKPSETVLIREPDKVNVSLRIHSKTAVYQYLEKEGLLRKNFPEWYAQGLF